MEPGKIVWVQIVGAQVACAEGLKDTWREVAAWAAGQLENRFGEAVRVRYYDLFDPDCPPLPQEAKLPLVIVDGEVLSAGGKLSVPQIRRKLEALGLGGRSASPVNPAERKDPADGNR
jgi:disulfide oxidoreductase YuzD